MQAHRRLDLVRYVGSRADTYDPKYGELATQELGLTTAVERPEDPCATNPCGQAATRMTRSDLARLGRVGKRLLEKPRRDRIGEPTRACVCGNDRFSARRSPPAM